MFVDSEFPPNDSSLGDKTKLNVFTEKIHNSITWRRITDLYSKPVEVFHNIHPNDILQGSLGNCYLLSAISALAEYPERVKKLFYTQEASPNGKYKIGMYHKGNWTYYEIDDYFPCIGNTIAFSGPRFEDNVVELWVILLEKAWAKRHGGYFEIEEGYTDHVLRDLTGAPCEKIFTTEQNLWEILFSANKKKYIINGCIGNSLQLNNSIGLVTLHSYAVIETVEFCGEQLLQIRNPWGRHEWTGNWSDSSWKWTPEAKTQLKWENKDDGCFWMNLYDFAKYFNNVTICMVEDSFKYTSLSSRGECFKVSMYSQGLTYFNVTQEGESPVRIIVASSNGYIAGKSGVGRDVWISVDCEHDDYFIYTERCNNTFPITISVYSEKNVKIEEFANAGFLQNMLKIESIKNNKSCSQIEVEQGVKIYKLEMIGKNNREFCEGFIYDIIENSRKDRVLIEFLIKSYENIEIIGNISMMLDPGKSTSIVFKQLDLLKDYKLSVEVHVKVILLS